MVEIDLNNNKFRLSGNLKILNRIYDEMAIRHPNAYFLRPHMPKGWDGKIKYVSETGLSKTGLLSRVINLLESYEEEYYIIDRRETLEIDKIPSGVADFIARPYQLEAVRSVVHNIEGDIIFPRGVIAAATNAGKTLIAAMLHKTYIGARTIIMVKNATLYEQFLDDMPKFFGDNWGYMRGKKLRWGEVMVCMTATLRNRLTEFKTELASYNVLLFDECHESTSKTNKKILMSLHNTIVRVGLSGTPFHHKDKIKNMNIESFFGKELYKISNLELIEKGFSTPPIVKIHKGNTLVKIKGNYQEEYRQAISLSEERNGIICDRVQFYKDRGQLPLLIIVKFHEHVDYLYEMIQDRFPDMDIRYIHHAVKQRKQILDEFKAGKFPILISSLIIKLGQNMPLIRCMINASSGDSHINCLQVIGRVLRTHESKSKVYYEDFFDQGAYVMRHSKHRIKHYKNEGFKVIELYKDKK